MFHVACLAFILASCATGHSANSEPTAEIAPIRQSFDLQVPQAPAVVPVGRERRLAYELHLTSFAREALTVTQVEAIDDATGEVRGRLNGPALEHAFDIQGATAGASGKRTIEAGRRAIVYFDLPVIGRAPAALRHRVTFDAAGASKPWGATVTAGRTHVDARPLPILGPPLRGGPWVAVYDPRLERGHRQVVYAVGGKATIPGRHAIDWMRPDITESGAAQDDPARGAGAEVLAVADGLIASTRDGVPEPTPGAARPQVSLAEATGNFVSISIGGGRYAFYEHLMPGLLVKPGDRVRRGQVIGRLGSTGQASRPHLHFHLADANSPLAAEGLPYALAGGRMIGAYESIAAFESGRRWMSTPELKAGATLPAPNAVIMFSKVQPHRR